jgi:predicted acetyltransferase
MSIIDQIKDMCNESENGWFLTHNFPKIGLYDLEFEEKYKLWNTDEKAIVRYDDISKIVKNYKLGNIYDFETEDYVKSHWIFPDKIDEEIPGFILIKCNGGDFEDDGFTHEVYFAFVKEKYRNRGILKSMVEKIPKEWNIWLEASSNQIDNVENIWEKCGFVFHEIIKEGIFGNHLIYKRKLESENVKEITTNKSDTTDI